MESMPSHHSCNTPSMPPLLEDNHTVTINNVTSPDPLYSCIFHCDEDILEEITTLDFPWNVFHHRALFLSQKSFDPPSQASIYEIESKDFIPSGHIDWFNNPIPAPYAFEEGNMEDIYPTVKIDISIKPGMIEEITIGTACSPDELTDYKALFQEYRDIFSWSYMEMPGLDPSIIEHHIDTWPYVTPVFQNKFPLHPSKEGAIKAKIDKLCAAGFIYPITYTSWVSNPILVNKKQGTIRICTDFHDLNHACPKDNFPTPTKLSMTVQAMRLCPSWMVSLATIKSKSIQKISIKLHLPPHGVLLLIMSCLLASRMQGLRSNGP
jgi:hypothetical protein